MQQPRHLEVRQPGPSAPDASLAMRFGAVLGAGAIAAVIAALPAAIRMGLDSPVRALAQWLALSALLVPFTCVASLVVRRARVGLGMLVGDPASAPNRPSRALFGAALLWGVVVELAALAFFGTLLRKFTHHRGLAGVTFAVYALATGIAVALFAVRSARTLARFDLRVQRLASWVAIGVAAVAVLLVVFRTSGAPELHVAAATFDLAIVAGIAAFSATATFARIRSIAFAGGPAAVLVFFLGLTVLFAVPELRPLMPGNAPVQAAIVEVLSGDAALSREHTDVPDAVPAASAPPTSSGRAHVASSASHPTGRGLASGTPPAGTAPGQASAGAAAGQASAGTAAGQPSPVGSAAPSARPSPPPGGTPATTGAGNGASGAGGVMPPAGTSTAQPGP